jgi:hypothetical protein
MIFQLGHKETSEEKEKRVKAMAKAWRNRADYHGMYNTKFYNSWRSMVTRCRGTGGGDSKRKYKDKGITVCDKWLKFKGFYEDMYPSYVHGLTIDRKENDKGYYKENCRWATPMQQANNTGVAIKIEYHGKKMTIREWSEEIGVSRDSLKLRYYKRYLPGLITLDELMTYQGRNFSKR